MKRAIGSGTCVVDLGCGSGHLLNALSERFEQRIGLDVSRMRLDTLASGKADGWEFREADLNGEFPLADASADAVVANQVIEHILDPIKFSREIHRILRPGGRCVVTTPNVRYLKNIAHLVFSGYGPRTAGGNTLDGVWDDGHIHYFTHRDLREIFEQAGFSRLEGTALIDLSRGGRARNLLDRWAASWLVRELLSGNILLWAEK
nr:class I SAM-dependent methyltransferase [Abyssibacter sp.]